MIFVTLGSQKFQFNRLLQKLDELIERGVIRDSVFAQTGASDYVPKHFPYTDFLDRDAFEEAESKADLVITHGGTGAIIGAVKRGVRVIAVPRLAKYGEHVDDHQLQLLRQFDDMGIIEVCYDLDRFPACYEKIRTARLRPYESNTARMIESIEAYLNSQTGERPDEAVGE